MELHRNKYSAQLRIRVVHTDIRLAVLTAFHHAAFAPRPVASPPAAIAIDCSADTPLTTPVIAPAVKTCRTCAVEKPMTEFYAYRAMRDGFRNICKACMNTADRRKRGLPDYDPALDKRKAARARLESAEAALLETAAAARVAKPVEIKADAVTAVKTIADLVTFDSLKGTARRLKGRPAVYEHGRTCITAVHDRKRDDFDFTIGGWPVSGEDMARVFAQIESGQGLRGLF